MYTFFSNLWWALVHMHTAFTSHRVDDSYRPSSWLCLHLVYSIQLAGDFPLFLALSFTCYFRQDVFGFLFIWFPQQSPGTLLLEGVLSWRRNHARSQQSWWSWVSAYDSANGLGYLVLSVVQEQAGHHGQFSLTLLHVNIPLAVFAVNSGLSEEMWDISVCFPVRRA